MSKGFFLSNFIFPNSLKICWREESGRILWVVLLMMIGSLFEAIGLVSIGPLVAIALDQSFIQRLDSISFLSLSLRNNSSDELLQFLILFAALFISCGILVRLLASKAQIDLLHGLEKFLTAKCFGFYLNSTYVELLGIGQSRILKNVLVESALAVHQVIGPILHIVSNAILLLFLGVGLALFNIQVFIAVFVSIFLFFLGFLLVLRPKFQFSGDRREELSSSKYQQVHEALAGIRELKVFNMEEPVLKLFDKTVHEHARRSSFVQFWSTAPKYIFELGTIASITVVIVLSFGISDNTGVSTAALYLAVGYRVLPAAMSIYTSISTVQFGMKGISTLQNLSLDDDLSVVENSVGQGCQIKRKISCLKVDNLTFNYPLSKLSAIKNISCEFMAGDIVAITGHSGSGKSTLLNCLAGFLEPTSGAIFLDGVDKRQVPINVWWQSISLASQDSFVLDSTLLKNLTMGCSNVDMNRVQEALHISGLDDFEKEGFEEGLNTRLGIGGARLSGGQSQRVCLARALYKKTPLIFFDEVTSGLDAVSKGPFLDFLRRYSAESILVLVTHDSDVVSVASKVVHLHKGKFYC